MTGLAVAAGLATLAILYMAVRRPVLARIAVRGAARRKGETLLVIAGSLLGTAIITGSLLVGDTLDASVRASAPNQLGPVDLIVRGSTPEAAGAAVDALADFDSADVDGVLEILTADAAVATGTGDRRSAAPRSQLLEIDFVEAAAFGGDTEATGISGATPREGGTVIGADLAEELAVGPGDDLKIYAYGAELAVTVERVLPRTGVAGFWTGYQTRSLNAFVAPGTIDELASGAAADPGQLAIARPPSLLTLVSAEGDVYEGAERTAAVTAQLEAALDGVALDGVDGVEVRPVKEDVLEAADDAGANFGELFLAIGSFAVIAGILLLVNIFVMLAEERKSELGMLRAVGLKRRDLVRVFLIEGAVYSVAAAALGAVLGIGVGRVIVFVAGGIFAAFGDLTLTFAAEPGSIVTGFLVGLLISLATILVTSLRISRINIIRAIRDLPEPTQHVRRGWRTALLAVFAVAGWAGSVAAIAAGDAMSGLAVPALAALCTALLLSRFLPRRPVVSLFAVATLVWAILADRFVDFSGGDITVFVVQGVVLTAAAVALVSQNQESIGRMVRLVGGGRSLVARLGLAYPLARRFRTSMTLAMYSLVVFTLVFISVLSGVFGGLTEDTITDEAGGFDLLATTSPTARMAAESLADTEGVSDVAQLTSSIPAWTVHEDDEPRGWPATGISDAFVEVGAPSLESWDEERFADQAAVWRAVLDDETLVVVDTFFLEAGAGPPAAVVGPGETVSVHDPASGRVSERTVAGVSRAGVANSGVMLSQASLADAVNVVIGNRYYLTVAQGADAEAVAARLQGEFVEQGLEAETFRGLVEQATQANLQFFRLMQGYLALGLIVGIAGLGVIMVRAVRERRREIGMLRSLGFTAGRVRNTFLTESTFVALEGIAIGTILALITSYQVITNSDALGDFSVGFSVPWNQLAILLGAAIVASILATLAPAQSAAHIQPAVALRIAD